MSEIQVSQQAIELHNKQQSLLTSGTVRMVKQFRGRIRAQLQYEIKLANSILNYNLKYGNPGQPLIPDSHITYWNSVILDCELALLSTVPRY